MTAALNPDPVLIDLIYSAAMSDAGWAKPMKRMIALTEMHFGALFNLDSATGKPSLQALVAEDQNCADIFMRQYIDEFHVHDPTPDLVVKWPAGRWFMDADVLAPLERQHGIFYNEFLHPLGATNWAGMFVNRGSQSAFLSFTGAPGQTMTLERQYQIDAVRTHIARAMELARRLGDLEMQTGLQAAALDAVSSPVFLLDEEGRLLLDNAAGRNLAAHNPRALNFRGNRFSPAVLGWDLAHWRAACKRGALTLVRADGQPLQLLLAPVPPQVQLSRFWVRPLILMSASGIISHTERAEQLQTLYRLTPAEAELAVMLACKGWSPKACADAKQVSDNTIRTQIKSIQAKLDIRRLPMLVAKVLSL